MLKPLPAAKQTIAKGWKSLAVAETKHRVNCTLLQAKMEAINENQISKFYKIWQPWIKLYLPPHFEESVLRLW